MKFFLFPSGTPAADGAALGSPGSVWVRAVTATPAAGVEAVAGEEAASIAGRRSAALTAPPGPLRAAAAETCT